MQLLESQICKSSQLSCLLKCIKKNQEKCSSRKISGGEESKCSDSNFKTCLQHSGVRFSTKVEEKSLVIK